MKEYATITALKQDFVAGDFQLDEEVSVGGVIYRNLQNSTIQSMLNILHENSKGVVGRELFYTEYFPVGSRSTFSTAHAIPGEIPTFKSLAELVEKLNSKDQNINFEGEFNLMEAESISHDSAPVENTDETQTEEEIITEVNFLVILTTYRLKLLNARESIITL